MLLSVADQFLKGHDWSVAVSGLDAAGVQILERDLGQFYPIVEQRVGELIAELSIRIETPQEIDRMLSHLRLLPYREIPLHFPIQRVEGRRTGRLSRVGNQEVVHSIRTGSKFEIDTGSIYEIDPETHSVIIVNASATEATNEVRRIFRDELLIPWSEQNGHTVLHGAAFSLPSGTSLVVGPSGAGKTTFFLAALEVGGAGVSCERVMVRRHKDTPYVVGSPERINLHPGSLRRQTQLHHLSPPDVDEGQEWSRATKMLLPWRDIFDAFGAVPAPEPQPVARLIFPEFGPTFSVEPLSTSDARRRLEDEVLSGISPLKICNWLAFYHYDDSSAD